MWTHLVYYLLLIIWEVLQRKIYFTVWIDYYFFMYLFLQIQFFIISLCLILSSFKIFKIILESNIVYSELHKTWYNGKEEYQLWCETVNFGIISRKIPSNSQL